MRWSRISVVASLLVAVASAQETPAPAPAPAPAAAPASDAKPEAKPDAKPDAKADGKVDLRAEVAALEQVWKRRCAFQWLKQSKETLDALAKVIDPTSAGSITGLVNDKVRADELEYHYVEKTKNCEQRILAQLRNDHFRGVADLLEALAKEKYPLSAGSANLITTVELNWRFAQRRKPQTVIDELGIAQRECLLEMRGLAVDRQALEFLVCFDEQRAAGSFVRASGLHSDEAIFDQVGAADTVLRSDFVQRVEKFDRTKLRAVHGDGRAGLESDFDFFGFVRSFFG
jgi:hypothetical protein